MIQVLAVLAAVLLGIILFIRSQHPHTRSYTVAELPEAKADYKGVHATKTQMLIHSPETPATISCYDPATSYYLGTQPATTPTQLASIVQKARKAQESFVKMPLQTRRAVLRSLLKFTVDNRDVICRVSARDSGKCVIDANFGEIIPTCEKLIWTIANGERVLAPEHRESGRISFMQSARIEYTPVGVMGAIVSWNYPYHNTMGPVISAIMAGNACVVKVSEHVAWSTAYYQSVISGALRANGVDEDLVRLVNGAADTGEALIGLADKIIFIGSPGGTNVGKLVMKRASDTLTPVILELGGKDAAVVLADADLDNVVEFCSRAAIQNAGQNCAGLERMIVHESVYADVVGKMQDVLGKARVGAPLEGNVDVGAMTMRSQAFLNLVDDAVAKGAIVQCGGRAYKHPIHPNFYHPTVLTGVDESMQIYHEEVFGPVLVIHRFSTDAQALAIANATDFGLSGSVFTRDYARGEKLCRGMRVGMSNVNGWGVNYLCQALPFGGVGKSGFGRFAGVEGLRGNCDLRSATTDKFWWAGVRTRVPPLLQYPMSEASAGFQRALLGLLYGDGVLVRVRAVYALAKYACGVSWDSATLQ